MSNQKRQGSTVTSQKIGERSLIAFLPSVSQARSQLMTPGEAQYRINSSSKCSNCYGPRAFGGPTVFCNKSDLSHYIQDFFQS